MTSRRAVVLRHVAFEHLGSFAQPLEEAGFAVDYRDVASGGLEGADLDSADLMVVLGGPIGVYETDTYPFLHHEIALVTERVLSGRPLLGICLGAQLIARAMHARVFPSGIKEIGFAPVQLTSDGKMGPLAALEGVPMLHWHGDTFDLPEGAMLLASTPQIRNQAFALGANLLALQFHPEADAGEIEHWLIGHAAELAHAGVDPRVIRADAETHGDGLRAAAQAMLTGWLAGLRF